MRVYELHWCSCLLLDPAERMIEILESEWAMMHGIRQSLAKAHCLDGEMVEEPDERWRPVVRG